MTIRITNFGSCSIDNVYSVPRFAAPGETLPTGRFDVHPGGKGLNQSIALARAGANVRHAGRVGRDGEWLKQLLLETGVDTELLKVVETTSGHAVIQVVPEGENSIVIFRRGESGNRRGRHRCRHHFV
ncbi:MAG: PfkB family carbohydrate kinase [Gammaproteobacteria bacterium]|nr:PfkB family carbohydrate kinase [Gammaproteobacteria bacterium]